MRQFRFLALLLLLSLGSSGCAWYQRFKADPIAALAEGGQYISTALNMARGAFDIYAATSNDPNIATTRASFNAVAGSVDRGLLVAHDGLRIAATVRGGAPDVTALLRDAQQGIQHVHEFLSGLPGVGAGRAVAPSMREALLATAAAARPLPN